MDAPEEIIRSLHPLERKVLTHLLPDMLQSELITKSKMQGVEVMRAMQWLENKKLIETLAQNVTLVQLDTNGILAAKSLPEKAFLKAVAKKTGTIQQIALAAKLEQGVASACVGLLKKAGCIALGADKQITITKQGKEALTGEWEEEKLLKKIGKELPKNSLSKKELELLGFLQKRKQFIKLTEQKDKHITLTTLGKNILKDKTSLKTALAERLTAQDLKSGAWKEKQYRAYDVELNVPARVPGKPHFVNEAIDYIKQVWLELGFQEMQGDMIQSAFWDLDALFVPQDHPAREMQDTFYIEGATIPTADKKVYAAVKAVHENGADTGSTGWGGTFSKEESEQAMLRTHTTVLSAQTLDAIKKGKQQLPGKYFIVGNVFRNEDLDWKHLFEFHQVDGIVVDENATFTDLLGYLELFFQKLGYAKVRIRPAHFPYTEPSAEVDGWHPVKKEWVELGGAGLFRPEVTQTLLGKEIPVLAWGIGLERGISEYFNITDIRELYGNDIKQLRTIRKWVK